MERRKKSNVLYNYTKEQLQDLLNNSNSYCDILSKIGLNSKGGNINTLKKIIKEYELNEDILNANRKKLYKKCGHISNNSLLISQEEYFKNGAFYHSNSLKKNLIERGLKEYKCEICGIKDWQGKPISLQVHHKDGNHFNNNLDNLQLLCPNCHSQTDTYAGKKVNISQQIKKCIVCGNPIKDYHKTRCKKCERKLWYQQNSKILKRISKNDLKDLIRKYPFTYIAQKYGVTDNAVRKWCKYYNLPYKKSEIKKYSNEDWEKLL